MADGNLSMPASTPIKTTCPYCGTGCGVEATPSGKLVRVAGDPQHPTNAGRLCVKGSALGDTVVPQGRLLHPQLRDKQSPGQPLQRLSWDAALDHAAGELRRIIDTHGPESVAWYVSGQLLTEDYYVANKLVKGFVGTANIDTNSRLCMSSAVAGHKRAFGEDIVPVAYEDLDRCDLVVLVGSNTAWCHPILFQRMLRAREARPQMKIVVLDPRKTASTEMADLHLGLRAGSDVRLFNGLLAHLHRLGLTDAAFVERSTLGLDETLAAADRDASLADIAADCGLEVEALERFYALFAATERVITCFSMGVNQSSAGTDKVNSIINCHLLTGRIGKPGAGPFSLTGQPNAMGGREVGGLANMLASHMDLEREEHRELVQRFWQSPAIASRTGLKAVDLFKAIESGEIKAVWIMATNPVVSLPDADQVRRALDQCELVIVSDVMAETDTTAYAHLLLPAQGWGEKDGTVTNSERCISRQRAFVPPLGEARPDWWMLSEVARRWGYAAQFPYRAVHEIFDEHARLSAFENEGARYFDIGGLAGLDAHAYDALAPLRWPVPRTAADARHLQAFADGRFYHADGLARFVPTPARAPANAVDADYPLVLNTGRVRDHWHTMTRTGLSATLSSHIPEPFVELNPADAEAAGIAHGSLARVSTRWGSLVGRAVVADEHARGSLFVPIHWNAQFASDARVGALVNPVVDPVSGEPEFKHTPAKVEAFVPAWHGFILSRKPLAIRHLAWWTRVTGASFTRYELAGDATSLPWPEFGRVLLGASADADWLEYIDGAGGLYRAAHVVDGRIEAVLFVAPRPDLPSRNWLASLFAAGQLDDEARIGLLAGEPLAAGPDEGATICSCFGVGQKRIVAAIESGQADSVVKLGELLKCGTNCGSCVPELKKILSKTQAGAKAASTAS